MRGRGCSNREHEFGFREVQGEIFGESVCCCCVDGVYFIVEVGSGLVVGGCCVGVTCVCIKAVDVNGWGGDDRVYETMEFLGGVGEACASGVKRV